MSILDDRVETIKILFKSDWQKTCCDFDTCLTWLGHNVSLQIRGAVHDESRDLLAALTAISIGEVEEFDLDLQEYVVLPMDDEEMQKIALDALTKHKDQPNANT